MRLRLAATAAVLLTLLAAACATTTGARTGPAAELHRLFEADWERGLRDYPENASYFGDPRYNDRWTDWSPAAVEARHREDRRTLEALLRIDRGVLPREEQVNYDLFRRQYEIALAYYPHRTYLDPVSPVNWTGFGFATALAQLMPFTSVKDYEDWIARLHRYGELVDQNIALMREGMRTGYVPPRVTMERIPRQVAAQVVKNPEDSVFYAPFKRIPDALPAADRERLQAQGRAAVRDAVVPAWRRFQAFFDQEYLPACRATIAATALPGGDAYYALRVRDYTTTDLTPDQIHGVGLKEVARIRGEMEQIKAKVKFRGTLRQFFDHLRTDARFYFRKPEDLLDGYRVISKKIDPELAKLFGRIPRTPYGVKPVPADEAPNATTAYYQGPAEDGSRPGWFYANLYRLDTRPKWEMEALTLHEAVPGHHFQIALAQELGELPKFRRLGGFTAFVEGWGLYAESLGEELGMYRDPYSKFGQLTYEMWRAIRLVVDTGMHAKGWTRKQAIDFFLDNAGKTENDVKVEVDRYIAWPGQALAYKIGELKIKELRARAAEQLGDRFDVRSFHDTVLGQGAVPLDVLERQIDEWIAARKEA